MLRLWPSYLSDSRHMKTIDSKEYWQMQAAKAQKPVRVSTLANQKRTPLKRSTSPIPRGKAPNKVSKKRASDNRKYSVIRAQWIEGKSCERCGAPATECHHKSGRENHRLLDFDNCAALCHICHRWAHIDTVAAKASGISKNRNV